MKNHSLIWLLLLLLVSIKSNAQNTSSEKAFIKSLIESEYIGLDGYKELNLKNIPYSVSLDDEGDPYTVYYSIIAHEDLNEDGIADYIVSRNSEGMLGGNVHSNQQYYFFIMQNEIEPDKTYEIFGYAPFSYNIINETSYENKRLKAHVVQNFRTYMSDDLQSTDLCFIYKDNNLYEESYLSSCELAKMKDKTIFKADVANVDRSLNIDSDNYTEISFEKYSSGDTIITATLSGCDNLALSFNIDLKISDKKEMTLQACQEKVKEFLHLLIVNTRYKTILTKVSDKYKTVVYRSNENKNQSIDKTWSYTISDFRQNKGTLNFSISIENLSNPNQTENWDITTRRKEF